MISILELYKGQNLIFNLQYTVTCQLGMHFEYSSKVKTHLGVFDHLVQTLSKIHTNMFTIYF